MKRDLPFPLLGWCLVIFTASFMPWASRRVGFPFAIFGELTRVITGWNGHVVILGLLVPNWVTVICAAFLAAIGWLRANSVDIGLTIPILLIVAGLGHCLVFFNNARAFGGTTFGLGFILTGIAYLAILRLFFSDKI